MEKWDTCSFKFNERDIKGRGRYEGLNLSQTTDITAFVLVLPLLVGASSTYLVSPQVAKLGQPAVPPRPKKSADFLGIPLLNDKYYILPYFWIPEDNLDLRVRRDHVACDICHQEGRIQMTEWDVVHYGFIENFIEELGTKCNIHEIAFDRWGAVQIVQNVEGTLFTVVSFGQGFKDMSPPSKELMKSTLERKLAHTVHPVLRWMMDNISIRTDPAGNIKQHKEKSTEKIDGRLFFVRRDVPKRQRSYGAAGGIMALNRAITNQNTQTDSVYNERGLIIRQRRKYRRGISDLKTQT